MTTETIYPNPYRNNLAPVAPEVPVNVPALPGRDTFVIKITMTRKMIVLVAIIVFCTSCTENKLERPEGLPKLLPCTVTVTVGGTPMDGIAVTMIPADGDSKWKPKGITDENGNAVMGTSYGFKGTPVGKYTVAFTKLIPVDEKIKNAAAQSLIPLKYGIGKSKETMEIKAGEKNEFSFALDAGEDYVR